MDFSEAAYRQTIENAFTRDQLRALLRGVIDGYAAAPVTCKRVMDRPDQHDAIGTVRRGKINEALRGVCGRQGLESKDEPNSCGSAFFLSIFSGELRLSAQRLSWRTHRIPSAEIREIWAAHNRDGRNRDLFTDAVPVPVPEGARFVAFLIHGPRRGHRDQPAFVDIVIPNENLRRFIVVVSLYELFPDVALEVGRAHEPKRKQAQPRKQPTRKQDVQ